MLGRRTILNLSLFLSILFFPWWISLFVAVLLLVFHRAYEVLFWALFFDSLYGAPLESLWGIEYLATFALLIIFFVLEMVKKKMIFYENV